jgi:hypothetical protein
VVGQDRPSALAATTVHEHLNPGIVKKLITDTGKEIDGVTGHDDQEADLAVPDGGLPVGDARAGPL